MLRKINLSIVPVLALGAAVALFGCSDDAAPGQDLGAKIDAPKATDGGPGDGPVTPNDATSDATPLPDGTPDIPANTPAHSFCATPKAVTLTNGKVEISDSTTVAVNEFGATVTCTVWTATGFPGKQLYYKVALKAGKTYLMRLEPKSVDLALYAFPAATACSAAAINAACKETSLDTPDPPGLAQMGQREQFLVKPTKDEEWVVVVDGFEPLAFGEFKLIIEDHPTPANGSCQSAEQLTWPASGPVTVEGNTIGTADAFPTLACGKKDSQGKPSALKGPQLFYALDLKKGQPYTIKFTPGFYANLVVFPASANCQVAEIETACAGTTSGTILRPPTFQTGQFTFGPPADGSYIFAVDSTGPMLSGTFKLSIEKQQVVVPTFTAPFSLDFESDCGNLKAVGDWECGKLAFQATTCAFNKQTPPTAGHSGMGVWGTVLNDCYNNAGNAGNPNDLCVNTTPNDDSIVKFQVTIPAGWTNAKLTYWEWNDMFGKSDFGEVRINTVVAQTLCELYVKPTAWVQRTIDFSAYIGTTIEVAFHFVASTVVNYSGWYLDDIGVSGS